MIVMIAKKLMKGMQMMLVRVMIRVRVTLMNMR